MACKQHLPLSWIVTDDQNYTSNLLLQPPTSSNVETPQLSGETLISNLLDTGTRCALRIVPVRNTDFAHLRDGFTRAVQARQKMARKSNSITEEDEVRIGESLQKLKGLFPAQSVPKGKALVLLRTPTGLTVEYEVRFVYCCSVRADIRAQHLEA